MILHQGSRDGSPPRFAPEGARQVSGAVAIVTAATVLVICASAYAVTRAQGADQAPRVVRVTAERFTFTPAEIKVPQGTTIELHIRSDDTAHGFRILGQAVDLTIPKRGRGEVTATFTPPAPGTYVFECSRMCGAGHSFMRGVIRVTAASSERP